jgi:hypothetical protein
MADYQKVEINEPAPNEVEPQEDVQGDVQDSERPDWLPEKFKTPEDMAKAYGSLESKLGAGAETEEQSNEDAQEETNETTDDIEESSSDITATQTLIEDASKEFFENAGELKDDTYEALAKAGLSRELVDNFARGQAALQENESTQIKSSANGEYDAMSEWAGKTLSAEEMNTFNDVVNNGTVEHAKLAVSGLHARYKAEMGGNQPKLVTGNTTGTSTMPYQSMQEVSRAMKDPRYKSGDKAYHAEVDRRLAVSNI